MDHRGRSLSLTAHQGYLIHRRTVHEPEGANHFVNVYIHQVVADEEVCEAGNGVETNVLQADHGGVLGAH